MENKQLFKRNHGYVSDSFLIKQSLGCRCESDMFFLREGGGSRDIFAKPGMMWMLEN